jgi:hypothetical protein
VVVIKHNNRRHNKDRRGSRRRTSSRTQDRREVVTWGVIQTAPDQRMSYTTAAAHTLRLLWRALGPGVRSRRSPTSGVLSLLARPPRECCRCLPARLRSVAASRPSRGPGVAATRRLGAPTPLAPSDRGAAVTMPPNLGTAAVTL